MLLIVARLQPKTGGPMDTSEDISSGVYRNTHREWWLTVCYHRGNIHSRDCFTMDRLSSHGECEEQLKKIINPYKDIGVIICFAEALGPNGEKISLLEETQLREVS
jgi:hypothetical protein